MPLTPTELQGSLAGILGFPVTPFDAAGELAVATLRDQVELLLGYGARAIFPGCGTGEMHSLTPDEYSMLVVACVDQVAGRVPVVAAAAFGHGLSRDMAETAVAAGADGLLAFPPSPPFGGEDGLADYFEGLAAALPIGIVLYQRDAVSFDPLTVARLARVPNIIGLKDGHGRVDLIQRQQQGVEDERFLFLNGTPTAELFAPALLRLGITTYSSALLNFAPEIAARFRAALIGSDDAAVDALMSSFIVPFVEIRERGPGYAISLVKAGARLRGLPVGHVRTPLREPDPRDVEELAELLERAGCRGPLTSPSRGEAVL